MRVVLPHLQQRTLAFVFCVFLFAPMLLRAQSADAGPATLVSTPPKAESELFLHVRRPPIPQPAPIMEEAASGTVPFRLYCGYLIVAPGFAGPLKNLSFLLDTGTSVPVLDSGVAKELHLAVETPANIVILGGRARGFESLLPTLSFGPVQRSNLPVIVTDLSFFRRILPVRIDAVVGLDVVGQQPFVIDYSAQVIRFGPPPSLPFSIPLRLDRGLVTFDAEIDHARVHLAFDTGVASLVLFDPASKPAYSAEGDAVQEPQNVGKFPNRATRLRTVIIGDEDFHQKAAILVSNPKPSQLDFDGLMSPPALGLSKVSVDLKGGVLAFGR